jgi:uncharacterized membrane protein YccC
MCMAGLYAIGFVVAAFVAFVLVPHVRAKEAERADRDRLRAEERRRREHFSQTEEFRRSFDPVLAGIKESGRAFDRM